MSYSKGRFVEQVLLRINGGQLNDDASVKREDIESYVPAAVNYTLTASRNIELGTENDRDLSSLFYGYFSDLPINVDAARHNWKYVNMPKGTIAMYANEGIRSVEDGCGVPFKPLTDNAMKTIHYYQEIFGERYYRLESGKRIYLFGINPVMSVLPGLSMIVDVDELGDDDILPIMAGMEGKAIDACVEFFTGERHEPADRKNDQRDIN